MKFQTLVYFEIFSVLFSSTSALRVELTQNGKADISTSGTAVEVVTQKKPVLFNVRGVGFGNSDYNRYGYGYSYGYDSNKESRYGKDDSKSYDTRGRDRDNYDEYKKGGDYEYGREYANRYSKDYPRNYGQGKSTDYGNNGSSYKSPNRKDEYQKSPTKPSRYDYEDYDYKKSVTILPIEYRPSREYQETRRYETKTKTSDNRNYDYNRGSNTREYDYNQKYPARGNNQKYGYDYARYNNENKSSDKYYPNKDNDAREYKNENPRYIGYNNKPNREYGREDSRKPIRYDNGKSTGNVEYRPVPRYEYDSDPRYNREYKPVGEYNPSWKNRQLETNQKEPTPTSDDPILSSILSVIEDNNLGVTVSGNVVVPTEMVSMVADAAPQNISLDGENMIINQEQKQRIQQRRFRQGDIVNQMVTSSLATVIDGNLVVPTSVLDKTVGSLANVEQDGTVWGQVPNKEPTVPEEIRVNQLGLPPNSNLTINNRVDEDGMLVGNSNGRQDEFPTPNLDSMPRPSQAMQPGNNNNRLDDSDDSDEDERPRPARNQDPDQNRQMRQLQNFGIPRAANDPKSPLANNINEQIPTPTPTRDDKAVFSTFDFDEEFNIITPPVDEDDDPNGNAGITPESANNNARPTTRARNLLQNGDRYNRGMGYNQNRYNGRYNNNRGQGEMRVRIPENQYNRENQRYYNQDSQKKQRYIPSMIPTKTQNVMPGNDYYYGYDIDSGNYEPNCGNKNGYKCNDDYEYNYEYGYNDRNGLQIPNDNRYGYLKGNDRVRENFGYEGSREGDYNRRGRGNNNSNYNNDIKDNGRYEEYIVCAVRGSGSIKNQEYQRPAGVVDDGYQSRPQFPARYNFENDNQNNGGQYYSPRYLPLNQASQRYNNGRNDYGYNGQNANNGQRWAPNYENSNNRWGSSYTNNNYNGQRWIPNYGNYNGYSRTQNQNNYIQPQYRPVNNGYEYNNNNFGYNQGRILKKALVMNQQPRQLNGTVTENNVENNSNNSTSSSITTIDGPITGPNSDSQGFDPNSPNNSVNEFGFSLSSSTITNNNNINGQNRNETNTSTGMINGNNNMNSTISNNSTDSGVKLARSGASDFRPGENNRNTNSYFKNYIGADYDKKN
ncbi:hypothetical protein BB561_006036 [Smittium simulii]|uniref:Uncharacterized protein n=1 Tax=Smittium simulii TaxID=133385 RepID=A0A2T9Y6Z0_9FUNG|nr:hypothetical protein BB561_006036 [Smittium simulii]